MPIERARGRRSGHFSTRPNWQWRRRLRFAIEFLAQCNMRFARGRRSWSGRFFHVDLGDCQSMKELTQLARANFIS
jgi:hypothetical protein